MFWLESESKSSSLMNLTILVIPHYKKGQVLYYGFRITEEWLIKHGITHGAAYNFPDYESHVMNVYYTRLILQQQTGIKQLAFEFVLPEKPPILPPKGLKLKHPLAYGRVILAVCTNLRNFVS